MSTVTITGGAISDELQKRLDWVASITPEFPHQGAIRTYTNWDISNGSSLTFQELSFVLSNGNPVVTDAELCESFPHVFYAEVQTALGNTRAPFRMYAEPDAAKPPVDLSPFGARTPDLDYYFQGRVTYGTVGPVNVGSIRPGPEGKTYKAMALQRLFTNIIAWVDAGLVSGGGLK